MKIEEFYDILSISEGDVITPKQARSYRKAGGKIICGICGRNKFSYPSPHKCNGLYRKRKILWIAGKLC